MERPRWLLWLILAALSLCLPAAAQAKSVFLNTSLFGKLNQRNPIIVAAWGYNGCPATATINALIYLQKNYPSVYGTYLVEAYDATTMATSAVTLGRPEYLNMIVVDGVGKIPYRDILWGTYLYMQARIDSLAPQTWASGVKPWTTDPYYWGWTTERPFPSWATISPIFTSADEIYNALNASRAVVIGWKGITIAPDGSITLIQRATHIMTVTGISWNSNSKTGTLYYIDPDGGSARTSPMWLGTNGLLWIDYGETNGVPWQRNGVDWWYSGIAEISFAMSVGPTGVAPLQPARHGAVPDSILLLLD
jgi:hypothetical protein